LLAASLSSRLNVPDRNIARGERVNAAHRRMAPQGKAKKSVWTPAPTFSS